MSEHARLFGSGRPVSVILPVYNPGHVLYEAVQSMLNQTHRDFELIIINDGSTDASASYLDALTDPRVRVVHQENRGLVATLNRGLGMARHELVARMDADDVSRADRLDLQSELLTLRPDVVAVGCCYNLIDIDGTQIDAVHVPDDAAYLRRQLYFRNVLPHGAMMFRKSAVNRVGGYRENAPAEDYDLWTRLSDHAPLASVPQTLYLHRVMPTGISQSSAERQHALRRHVRDALWARQPVQLPSPLRLASEGRQLVRSHQHGNTLAQSFAFDHIGISAGLARRGRWPRALLTLMGVATFALTQPTALHSLALFQFRRPGRTAQHTLGG